MSTTLGMLATYKESFIALQNDEIARRKEKILMSRYVKMYKESDDPEKKKGIISNIGSYFKKLVMTIIELIKKLFKFILNLFGLLGSKKKKFIVLSDKMLAIHKKIEHLAKEEAAMHDMLVPNLYDNMEKLREVFHSFTNYIAVGPNKSYETFKKEDIFKKSDNKKSEKKNENFIKFLKSEEGMLIDLFKKAAEADKKDISDSQIEEIGKLLLGYSKFVENESNKNPQSQGNLYKETLDKLSKDTVIIAIGINIPRCTEFLESLKLTAYAIRRCAVAIESFERTHKTINNLIQKIDKKFRKDLKEGIDSNPNKEGLLAIREAVTTYPKAVDIKRKLIDDMSKHLQGFVEVMEYYGEEILNKK